MLIIFFADAADNVSGANHVEQNCLSSGAMTNLQCLVLIYTDLLQYSFPCLWSKNDKYDAEENINGADICQYDGDKYGNVNDRI